MSVGRILNQMWIQYWPMPFFSSLQDKTGGGGLSEEEKSIRRERIARMRLKMTAKHKLVAHSTAMESIQAQTDPIDGEDNLP